MSARPILAIVILFGLAGCTTTTPEVLQLSRTTAINAGLLTAEIQRFAEDEQRFADARRRNIQWLHDAVHGARERFEIDRLYTRETAGDDFKNTEKELREFIAKVDKVIEDVRKERVEVAAPKPVSVDDRVQALAALAKSMATLAKPSDLKTDLSFLKGYIEAIQVHVEAAQEADPVEVIEDDQERMEAAVVGAANARETNDGGN